MRQSQHGCYGKIQDYCFFDNNMPSCSQENDIESITLMLLKLQAFVY